MILGILRIINLSPCQSMKRDNDKNFIKQKTADKSILSLYIYSTERVVVSLDKAKKKNLLKEKKSVLFFFTRSLKISTSSIFELECTVLVFAFYQTRKIADIRLILKIHFYP